DFRVHGGFMVKSEHDAALCGEEEPGVMPAGFGPHADVGICRLMTAEAAVAMFVEQRRHDRRTTNGGAQVHRFEEANRLGHDRTSLAGGKGNAAPDPRSVPLGHNALFPALCPWCH